MLCSFAVKAIATRRKSPWGQERQGESCVTTITCQYYYLSSPSRLSINTSHNKSTWKGEKSSYIFHTCFFPLSVPTPLHTNLPTVYRASSRKYKGTSLPIHNRNPFRLVLLKTLENKLDVSEHVFFRIFQSSCANHNK